MRDSDKRHNHLFNYNQAYVCTHDPDGVLLSVHPAICELLGYEEGELKGQKLSSLILSPDARKPVDIYLERLKDGIGVSGVFRVAGKTGKKNHLLFRSQPTGNGETLPRHIISLVQPIAKTAGSDRHPGQKKNTEDPNKAKETFLANMSHEIRTPMTGILGIAHLLSKTDLNEQQKKFTNLISESANSLLTIVNDVLDIEKIAAGKLDLELIPFKIEDKVFTTLQSFQFKAEDKNINLLLNSSLPDNLVVVGDPYRLSQILNNLLSNALKFTNEGSITLNMDYRHNHDKSIIVDVQVQDTGIGIEPGKLSDIFRPFTQAATDTTRKFGGTGLGLTICKNLVEMQGGQITVVSALNAGTNFSFFIPYEKGDESMLLVDGKDNLNYKDLESIKILVAEDVELNKFLVRHILEAWGCDVTMVNNGREAVEKVKRYHYDLILMDIQMPEMDGITATKIIRNLNSGGDGHADKSAMAKKTKALNLKDKSDIPIIAITANALKGDGQRYMNYGMNGYITKPYTEEKLFHAINLVIKADDRLKLKVSPSAHMPHGDIASDDDEQEAEQGDKLYDLSMMVSLSKDDISFVKEVVSLFLQSMPENMEALLWAESNNDYDLLSKTAHKMKGQIDLFHINPLKGAIRELESTKSVRPNTKELINNTDEVLQKVFIQLRKFVNSLSEAGNLVK